MPILDLQLRMRELGRIRLGDKGSKGQPQRLDAFRLTTQNRALLDVAAGLWGGAVLEWGGGPTEGQWELYTATAVLPIALPPATEPVSQWMEQWSTGGCTHRCDTVRNHITDAPCSCDPDARACRATTRVSVMLPDIPDVGVWRLESHGWNAAVELPGTLAVIEHARRAGVTLRGSLRIDHRVAKRGGETRRFVVPVIDLDVTVGQLLAGEVPASAGLPAHTEVPALPVQAGDATCGDAPSPPVATISEAQRRRLFAVAKRHGVAADRVKGIVRDVTGQESTRGIAPLDYEAVVAAVEAAGSGTTAGGRVEPLAAAPPAPDEDSKQAPGSASPGEAASDEAAADEAWDASRRDPDDPPPAATLPGHMTLGGGV